MVIILQAEDPWLFGMPGWEHADASLLPGVHWEAVRWWLGFWGQVTPMERQD